MTKSVTRFWVSVRSLIGVSVRGTIEVFGREVPVCTRKQLF